MRDPFFAPDSYQADGFTLRGCRLEDAAATREAALSSYEHLRPWMSWAVPDEPLEVVETRCRRHVARYLTNEDFLIRAWIGDEMVGSTGFHLRGGPLQEGCAEVGMWIRASRAGEGLGTRVLRAMLDWGFGEWGWERLVWKCDTRNVASARVAEKCGLRLEGTFRSDALDVEGQRRDTHLYAILKGEHLQPGAQRGPGTVEPS